MSPLAESIVLWLAFAAGWLAVASTSLGREPSGPPVRVTWWASALWLVVAVPSVVQLAVPGLLDLGMRNDAILGRGEWWRILTANVLQDGGLAGTLSNLSVLAVTLLIVGRVVSGAVAVPVYVLGGIGSMLLQLSHPGAGNSMATLALLAGTSILTLGRPLRPPAMSGFVLLVAIGAVLTMLGDEHGPAIVLGLAIGAVIRLVSGRQPATHEKPGGATDRTPTVTD